MTDAAAGLTHDIRADDVRESPRAMRTALHQIAARGEQLWVASFADVTDALIQVARVDLCLARLVEGHVDGHRIIAQAECPPRDGVYGVWASRSVGTGVKAARIDGGWHLTGELRFASGIDVIDRALVSAWQDEDHHVLLDVDADGVTPDRDSWHTAAMDASRSFTVSVDLRVADTDQVGGTNFYLDRPGFVVGGLGVAAVWAGGAQQVADLVTTGVRRFATTPHQLRRIGVIEQAAWQATTLVQTTVRRLGALARNAADHEIAQTRTAVVHACDVIMAEAALVVGPAGLSHTSRLARTLQDLAIYVRQHHVDNELARLGGCAVHQRAVLGA